MDVTWKAKGSRVDSDYDMRYILFFAIIQKMGKERKTLTEK
jgi:hypothetical protein